MYETPKVDKEEQNLDNYNNNDDIDDPDYECNTSLERTTINEMKSFIETST